MSSHRVNAKREVDLIEAAAQLRVPYHTAHRWVLTGALQGVRRGGRWYVSTRDLKRLIRSRTHGRKNHRQ